MAVNIPLNRYSFEDSISSYIQEVHSVYQTEPPQKHLTIVDLIQNKLLMVSVIKKGISFAFFEFIQHLTPFSEFEWAQFLDLSTKSLQRYKVSPNFHFKSIHSEKILELAEVTHYGVSVFGNLDKFNLWLKTPNFALGNYRPLDLLSDSFGKDLVMAELNNIEQGVFV